MIRRVSSFVVLALCVTACTDVRVLKLHEDGLETDFVPGAVYVLTKPTLLCDDAPLELVKTFGTSYYLQFTTDEYLKKYSADPSGWPVVTVLPAGTRMRCEFFGYEDFFEGSWTRAFGRILDGKFAGKIVSMSAGTGRPKAVYVGSEIRLESKSATTAAGR